MSARRGVGTAPDQLIAIANGAIVGTVYQQPRTGWLSWEYDEAWQQTTGAFPISVAMPLAKSSYEEPIVRTVLAGWTPDRPQTLERLATEYHVDPSNPFALLSVVGEDCPGAIQFARPDRADALRDLSAGSVTWLTEADLAARLRQLGTPSAPERLRGDKGRFSLPGAQPKTALVFEAKGGPEDPTDAAGEQRGASTGEASEALGTIGTPRVGQWGVPEGTHPTTHIIKPPMGDDARYLAAEYLTLHLARVSGLSAADAFVVRAEDKAALAVVRYDRARVDGRWLRAHQEDLCQAMGYAPTLKFESSNGPGVVGIAQFLRDQTSGGSGNMRRFLEAIAFVWVVMSTDAHARNYSLLIGRGGASTLAPLYDIMSVLGIAAPGDVHTLTLSMQIGGKSQAHFIERAQWVELAGALSLRPDDLLGVAGGVAVRVVAALPTVAQMAVAVGGLDEAMVATYVDRVGKRAARCARQLGVHP